MHGDGVRVKGTGAERDNGARARTGRCRGPGQQAIRVHGDGARVHGKVQGTGAERDNGARGTVHGCTGRCMQGTGAERDNGARVHGKVQEGSGAERDNGARGRCLGAREGAGRDRGRAR